MTRPASAELRYVSTLNLSREELPIHHDKRHSELSKMIAQQIITIVVLAAGASAAVVEARARTCTFTLHTLNTQVRMTHGVSLRVPGQTDGLLMLEPCWRWRCDLHVRRRP